MKELDININIQGDILLSINIVFDEIKHIFSKLLNKSMINFKENSSLNNKFINISFEEINESIFITYEDNAKIYENIQIDRFFLTPSSLLQDDFDLGFYLVKVFIEKNFGLISIEKTNDGIKYIIRFDK